MVVCKRDGLHVGFDESHIYNAIKAASEAVGVAVKIDEVCTAVVDKLKTEEVTVEEIQDKVEQTLMEMGYHDVAKAYILYRNKRTEVREANSNLMKILGGIHNQSREASDTKRENANINTDAPMGVMLKIGSETAKEYALKNIIDEEFSEAHRNGDIHIHDLDFYALTATCVQIPLGKLLKNGFTTGHGYLRTPKGIGSTAALTCIALQSSQNDMHRCRNIPCH